jgi:exosortase A-associated hydrolase 1
MTYREEPLRFVCADASLLGIVARPAAPAELGVVIVVGGPQTRVGSHRQFVLLSRTLAAAGYATLRFDYRGMGDSSGEPRDFEGVNADIKAAINALQAACPTVDKIVLWGLCDAAAAALLYWDASRDPRIAGMCLLNPWVRSAASLARAQVKHYYGQRLLQQAFWLKLLRGQLNVVRALAGLFGKLRQAAATVGAEGSAELGFQDRMARAWRDFPGQILLLLSGSDYTAKEFLEYTATAESWRGLLARSNVTRADIEQADHTFSSAASRDIVAAKCLAWLRVL